MRDKIFDSIMDTVNDLFCDIQKEYNFDMVEDFFGNDEAMVYGAIDNLTETIMWVIRRQLDRVKITE